jgi:peroxygenase
MFTKTDDMSGTARANEAASVEHPNGTQQDDWARRHRDQTVLQQHIAFFDSDSDGVIWPLDTFNGFHRLGYNLFLCVLSVVIIHGNFSYPTVSGWLPDPFFRIYTARIHKDKHGSDSGTYDTEGRFVPQKFEDIFAKYAGGDKKGITLREIFNYMKGQRLVFDPFGWFGALFECE